MAAATRWSPSEMTAKRARASITMQITPNGVRQATYCSDYTKSAQLSARTAQFPVSPENRSAKPGPLQNGDRLFGVVGPALHDRGQTHPRAPIHQAFGLDAEGA